MTCKTFCICLPEQPEKIEKAKTYFLEQGLSDVEFFWGIDAQKAGLQTEHLYEVDHPGSGWKMGYIPTGIWLAHYALWNTLKHLSYDRVLILENDVKFDDDWRDRFDRALQDVPPDFDVLYTGSCCVGEARTHIAGDVYECKQMQCTHSYMIQRNALSVLLSTLRKVWAPIDIQMQMECFPQLKTYVVLPRIFSQWNTEIPP